MLIARDRNGFKICARCGRATDLTKDHFIPKSCRMDVNNNGNYVGICVECNREKAARVVQPSWYIYLSEEQKSVLKVYMRYCRSWIRNNCTDNEVLKYIEGL